MPKKSKRVASRQAQLSQRHKQKGHHGPTGIPTQPKQPEQQLREGEHETQQIASAQAKRSQAMTDKQPPPFAQDARAAPLSQAPVISRGVQRGRQPLGATAPLFVKREILRIGVLSGIVIAVLVALSFVID